MIRTTRKQRETLHRKWTERDQNMTYKSFRANVHPTFGCDDAVTVQWDGMWLCIEKDGYCHT